MQLIMKPERSSNFSYYMHTLFLKKAYQCVKGPVKLMQQVKTAHSVLQSV